MRAYVLSIVVIYGVIDVQIAHRSPPDGAVTGVRSEPISLLAPADRVSLPCTGGNLDNAIALAKIVRMLDLPSFASVLSTDALQRYQLVAAAMQRMPPQDVDLAIACALAAVDLCEGDTVEERLRIAVLIRIAFVFDESPRPHLLPDRMRPGGVPIVPISPEFADAATADASPLSWRGGQLTMVATSGSGDMHFSAVLDEWRTAVEYLPKRDLEAFSRGRDESELIHDLLIELDPELSHDEVNSENGESQDENGK